MLVNHGFLVSYTPRLVRPVKKNTSAAVVEEPSDTADDFVIPMLNPPAAKPPRDASEEPELRYSYHTRHPLECFAFDIN